MDLQDLHCFDDFKQGTVINELHTDEILGYQKLVYSKDLPPYFRLSPTIGTLSGSTQFRYLVIAIGTDSVMIMYKLIQLYGRKIIKIFNYPISKHQIIDNEDIVIAHLKQLPFVTFAINYMRDGFQSSIRNADINSYDDYYYDFNEHPTSGHKYRHHHRVDKILNSHDYDIKVIQGFDNTYDYSECVELFDIWTSGLKYVVGSQRVKEYKNYLLCNKLNFIKNVISYKGTVISVRIWAIDELFGFARSYYNINSNLGYPIGDVDINRHLSYIQKYLIEQYLKDHNISISKVYIAGAGDNTSLCKLKQHKEEISQGKVEYRLYKYREEQ